MRARHAEVLKSIADLNALAGGAAEAAERVEILQLASERDTAMAKVGSPALRALYERANVVVADASWSDPRQCPVCDTKLTKSISEHLRERIAQYAAADDANTKLESAVDAATCIVRLGALETVAAMGVPAPDKIHGSTTQAAHNQTLPTAELNTAFARLDALEANRAKIVQGLETERADIEKKLPPSLVAVSKTLASVRQFCEALAAHEKSASTLSATSADLAVRQRWQDFIVKARDSFSAAETALANQRIGQIETEYQALFVELVRGGPNMRPTLERAAGSENVDLKLSDFHGLSDINARAVLSESYRNAVAASIFLAAAIRYNGTPRFVILDDVTSSFDAGHQFSLMEAIRTKLQQPANPDGLQIIILSHDSALEKYFDKQNGTVDWSHQKLQGMPPIGRVMVSAQEADRLKVQAQSLLNGGQVDLGAPFVRQYLEYKLGHIISKLEIPCPPDYATRGDKRTLSTYIDAIVDAVDLYQAGAYALLGVLQNIDALADCFTWTDTSQRSPMKKFYKRLDRQ